MLSLHLSEWLEWKCRSVAQSVGFLYGIVDNLRSASMWIFMSRKDISWVECLKVNLIVGWRLFMKSFMDWSCSVLFGAAYEDQEDIIYESLPERDCPEKGFPDGFFVMAHEEVGI